MNLPWPIILASTSRYRSELFALLGWPFSNEAPGVDEDQYKNSTLDPEALAIKLSQLKAEAVFKRNPRACVIGSDQVCRMGSTIFSKPKLKEKALEQLTMMQGQTHELLTAVTVCLPGEARSFVNKTRLHMRDLSQKEIEAYLDFDQPYDCAGSYKLESRGIKLFKRIEMSDHTAIIGLPLIELTTVLVENGYSI